MKRKTIFKATGIAAAIIFCIGCGGDTDNGGKVDGETDTTDNPNNNGGVGSSCSVDFDSITIGTQVWMAENLNCDAEGGVCYRNSLDSCAKYGRLYTWDAALKVCPAGWRLPTDDDWTALTDFLGSTAGTKLKSPEGWDYYSGVPAGTDDYGFYALPGGLGNGGGFGNIGGGGFWWSATEYTAGLAWGRAIHWCHEGVLRNYYDDVMQLSVRCVKD